MSAELMINTLQVTLNRLINKNVCIETTETSKDLLETLKIMENCTGCKDTIEYFKFYKSFKH